MTLRVVDPTENFRGLSYGDWIEVWSNWLFSSYPNYIPDEDMLFCRGFLEYSGSPYDITQQQYIIETPMKDSKPTKSVIRTTEKRLILNKDLDCEQVDLSDVVPTGTGIFLPLITAMYSIGHKFEGRTLDNEFDVRRAVMKDTYESREVYLKLTKTSPKNELPKLNLLDYKFETRLFPIRISDSSPFIGYHFEDIQPGTFESVAGGYFVIISDLPKGEYTLEFGGKGRDGYRTRTIQRVVVREERRNLIRDRSGFSPVTLIQ